MLKTYLTLFILSLGILVFSVDAANAEKINCSDDIDYYQYPICKFEAEWNESERFNELLVEELGKYQEEINSDPSNFGEIYAKVYLKIDSENPGLKEECDRIKKWIYSQLENN